MALLIGYFKLSDDKKAIINRAISKRIFYGWHFLEPPFTTIKGGSINISLLLYGLWIAECLAHTVLKGTSISPMHHALVQYSEAQLVAIGSGAISRQREHACYTTRLCPYIILDKGTVHAFAQCTVDACLGQRWVEMNIDILITVGVT